MHIVYHHMNIPSNVHSPVSGHLHYFQFGVIMNSAPMDMHLQLFRRTYIFIFLREIIPRRMIAGFHGKHLFLKEIVA